MAGIESLLSTFLYRSLALKAARSRLLDEVPRTEVKGFSTSLILVFGEHQADVLGEWADDANCTVIAYADALLKLRDRQQLAALIHSSELEVQGDIQVVQNFVALVDLAELGPVELLAPYTGDITAEGISKAMRRGARSPHHGVKHQQRYVMEVITKEWHMTPDPLEMAQFTEETAIVERAVDAPTKRLKKLGVK